MFDLSKLYGYKPEMSSKEMQAMNESSKYPKTQSEIDFEKKVDAWRKKVPDILVAPFNSDSWSKL